MCEQDNCSIPSGFCHCGCGGRTNLAVATSTARRIKAGEPHRFISQHHRRTAAVDYVEQDCGFDSNCWVWQRRLSPKGYPGAVGRSGRAVSAYRAYYEDKHGPLPGGMTLDHLCRNRACVNPDHLEPVTNAENVRRGKSTKLDWGKVRFIRASDLSDAALARRFGVSTYCIWAIRHGRTWVAD